MLRKVSGRHGLTTLDPVSSSSTTSKVPSSSLFLWLCDL